MVDHIYGAGVESFDACACGLMTDGVGEVGFTDARGPD